jgi:essential nuclear protein 1
MPKITTQSAKMRNSPLLDQLSNDAQIKPIRHRQTDNSMKDPDLLDHKTTSKLLKIARSQQLEIAQENAPKTVPSPASDDEDSDGQANNEPEDDYAEHFEGDWLQTLEIDDSDTKLLDKFMGPARQKISLSSMIQQQPDTPQVPSMNPKVIEVYSKVGILLSRYKSGPLPKTFKIIPTLRDWEQVLYITNPEAWTPQAVFQATRIFTSNLKSKMAQRFFSLILLERVRTDIAETNKLNYHLYMAVKKSLFKPAAFFKGFLLPLTEQACTLRESSIISSILVKVSIPALHSAAALLKLAEMEYTPSTSLFLRVLLDKKYALPFKVIDALVFHFIAFKNDDKLPVLWHQSLLVFSQRYKEDLAQEQKDALLDLIKVQMHEGISPEIRRELVGSVCRGQNADVDMATR